MHIITLLAFCVAAVTAVPAIDSQRIAGGSATTIEAYPTLANLLYTWNWSAYLQACGGTILNNRSILTGAHCPRNDPANRWRVRIGSSWANHGGIVHLVNTIIIHPNFDLDSHNNDIAILRTATAIVHNNAARPASIAGSNYHLADNQSIWAAGWGVNLFGGSSDQLRHVQIFSINQNTCVSRYATRGIPINDNMFCSGWLDVGGRDQCDGDSGGPIYHNGVVVGIYSFAVGCGNAYFPSVNTRVSRYTSWIQSNA